MSNIVSINFTMDKLLDITESYETLGISKLQARVFNEFYGLKSVAFCEEKNLENLLCDSILKTIGDKIKPSQVDYVIFPRTSLTNSPYSYGLLRNIVIKCNLLNAKYFGVSLNKCASVVEAFALVSNIFKVEKQTNYILMVSGDRAFTKQQRLLQNATIVGDATSSALFSRDYYSLDSFRLITIIKNVYPQFYKGTWISRVESMQFEVDFPKLMAKAINDCISKANLFLDDIRLILPHNVNYPIWEKISAELGCKLDKIFTNNISKYGHCFSNDSLINLKSIFNIVKDNEYILVATVGFGLTFVASIFQKIKGV